MIRPVLTALMLVSVTVPSAAAEVAREITWEDLVPAAPELQDPLTSLTMEQSYDIEFIAGVRATKDQGGDDEITSALVEEAAEATKSLTAEGVDVEAMVAAYTEFDAEIIRRGEMVVGDLDGQVVRMPGYALPLEFIGTEVKEFLLVPYVGACIHVPPPPVNQTVFVRLDKGFMMDDVYVPVWITGRMTVKRTSQALSYIDGQSDVAAGYSMHGISVEPYEE